MVTPENVHDKQLSVSEDHIHAYTTENILHVMHKP